MPGACARHEPSTPSGPRTRPTRWRLAVRPRDSPGTHLTPASFQRYPRLIHPDQSTAVRLRGGPADLPAFQRELAAIGNVDQAFPVGLQTSGVESATHTQAISLWVLALLVAAAGLAVFGQLLGRQTF